MGSKQQLPLRPISTMRDGRRFDGKANPSFRVYYSIRAGAVPFLWESAPGTPKRGASAVAPETGAAHAGGATMLMPPISPPPSFQSSSQPKAGRGRRPAGGIVRALLSMLGLGGRKSHRRSRRRPASYL